MSDYNYWNLICKLKNYYYGNRDVPKEKAKEVSGRIDWLNNYFGLFQNPYYFQKEKCPLPNLVKGNIILAELGFNIGMEFGGRHYCIVLKNSSTANRRVLVLPITTQKPSDYDKFKDTIYIEFNRIQGLNAKKDIGNPNGHKRWVNILNIRTISKNRVIYPVDRGIPNMMKGQMRIISTRIVSQVAMRYDLLEVNKNIKSYRSNMTFFLRTIKICKSK